MGGSMLGMLLLLLGAGTHQLETVLVKNYGKKYGKGGMFFNAIICLAATLYFFVTDKGGLVFPKEIWAYGIVNCTMYAVGFYSGYVAYKEGSYALTKLFLSFGILISIFYGIVILHEPTTPLTYIAVVLILFSLFLMNYQKNTSNTKNKISLKWIINIVLVVLSNAAIGIIGKMQYDTFDGGYKNEFLIISLAGAALSLLVLGFILERSTFKAIFKHGLLYGAGAGVCNGINNLLTLVVYAYLPISVASPIKSVMNIVLSFVVAVLMYKERFTKQQIVGVSIGVLAILLINL